MPPRKKLAQQTSTPDAEPVTAVKPHEVAWRMALELAEGDVRRLVTRPDGSVTVANHPQRGRRRQNPT